MFMYKGHIIHVSIGDKTHGNPGVVFFGDIPGTDMDKIAPIVRLRESVEDVIPSVVLLKPRDVKKLTFDAKFYWPLGKQGPICGQGVIMAARAIKEKYRVPDESIITLLPDQKFGPGAAPEKFHLKVSGNQVLSMLDNMYIAPVSKTDPAYAAIASALPNTVTDSIYRTNLGDYMCMFDNVQKLRASTDAFNAAYDKLIAVDKTAFGLLVVSPAEDGKGAEATLSSMGETCITCSNIGLEVGHLMNRFGLLPAIGKDGMQTFDITHPHRVVDSGEMGAKMTIKYNPFKNESRVDLYASVGEDIYIYKDSASVWRQSRILPAKQIQLANTDHILQHSR